MGQMKWRRNANGDAELYLCSNGGEWRHYSQHPERVRDGDPTRFSPGWLMYNKLIKAGWKLLPMEG